MRQARGLLTRLIPLLLGFLLAWPAAAGAQTEETTPAAWEQLGPAEAVSQLFTPASGAFFARTQTALLRSNDGGASWAAVALPGPLGRAAAVDPTNHAVVYLAGPGGLFKTTDDAATWSLVLPTTWDIDTVAISPADPLLLYVALKDQPSMATRFQLQRSRDGGASWELLESYQSSLCAWGVYILQPHATDPQRLFGTYACMAGRTISLPLNQSLDQATTMKKLFEPPFARPVALAGGRGAQPNRFYLAANRDGRMGGALLYRSDDDGATWPQVRETPQSNSMHGPIGPDITVQALTYDPTSPDRLYLALTEVPNAALPERNYRVELSTDGGATWASSGGPLSGQINDLALGIDGRNLYAATETGVWRLRLS